MSGTYSWTDPLTLERREVPVPQSHEAAFALVAHVAEPARSALMNAYEEGWYLKRTRLDALWYMDQAALALRRGI